jgi:GH35 family endo-1,4-beta-xylanase
MVFGHGWGPPPWTDAPALAEAQYNAFALPGYAGSMWKGPGQYDWSGHDYGVAWAASHPGWRYSSTNLFYGIFVGAGNNGLVPGWLRTADTSSGYGRPSVTPEQLSLHMKDFLQAYVQRYGTGAYRTEIGNELVSFPQGDWFFQNASIGVAGGRTAAQYIDQLARWAKAANPNVKLYVNDTRNEDTQTWSGTGNGFGALMRALKDLGSPIDGVGFQCHQALNGGYNYASIEGVFAYAASLGFDLHITELGIAAPVDGNTIVSLSYQAQQAAQMKALVTAFLRGGGARAKSIATWGTRDRPDGFDVGGMLFDVQSRPKTAFGAVLDALNQ